MIFQGNLIKEITVLQSQQDKMIHHCLRKLREEYLPEEAPELKAYGLIGGKVVGQSLAVELIEPLYKNCRTGGTMKEYMDPVLDQYAIPSETPLAKRGWAADPVETKKFIRACQQRDLELIGTYHMHRVPWEGDERREKPANLDTELAKDTELFMFIVAVVNKDKPVVRAFYEGYPEQELPIRIVEGDN